MPASIIIHRGVLYGGGRAGGTRRPYGILPSALYGDGWPRPYKNNRARPWPRSFAGDGPPLIFLFFLREEMIIKTNKGGTSPWLWRGKPSTLRLRGLRLLCVLVRATGAAVCFSLACRRTGGAGYAASSFDRRADHRLGADGSITHPRTAWQGDFLRVIRPCSLACSNRRRLVRKQRIGSLAHLSFPHKLS
jgi:hypothetical protein